MGIRRDLAAQQDRAWKKRDSGGGDFYDKVYDAERPEIFFKATPQRVVGPHGKVRIRSDSKWNVPEPELTLALRATDGFFGFSSGNDMSPAQGFERLHTARLPVQPRTEARGVAKLS